MTRQESNRRQQQMFAAWTEAQNRADQAFAHSNGNAWQAACWEAQCAMQQWMNSAGMGHAGCN